MVVAMIVTVPLLASAGDDKPVPAGSVEGTVTFEGKPLPGGTVAFHPAKGKPVVGVLRADGTYAIKTIPPGKYRVTIETDSAKPRPKDKAPPKDKDTPKTEPPGDAARYVPIPRLYGDANTTPLIVEVPADKQTFDINLRR
jgi:hypothetical protein